MKNKLNPKKPKLVLAKPPKPVNQMTEAERREWAEQIAQGLKPKISEQIVSTHEGARRGV
jgi:hypothetical protein